MLLIYFLIPDYFNTILYLCKGFRKICFDTIAILTYSFFQMQNTNTIQYVTDTKSIAFFKQSLHSFLNNLNVITLDEESTYADCVTSKLDFNLDKSNINILLKQNKYNLQLVYPHINFHLSQLNNLSSYLEDILTADSIIKIQKLLLDLCSSSAVFIFCLELNINSLYFQVSSKIDNSTMVISIEII